MKQTEAVIDWVVGGSDSGARTLTAGRLLVDPGFAAEVTALEAALGPLAAQGPDMAPPPELWNRLDAALDAEIATLAGTRTQRFDEGIWEDVSPGVTRKWLWGGQTYLLRVAPGATILDHEHAQYTEHCVVLQGSVLLGSLDLRPGDYRVAPQGTRHVRIHSAEGGLMLIRRGD